MELDLEIYMVYACSKENHIIFLCHDILQAVYLLKDVEIKDWCPLSRKQIGSSFHVNFSCEQIQKVWVRLFPFVIIFLTFHSIQMLEFFSLTGYFLLIGQIFWNYSLLLGVSGIDVPADVIVQHGLQLCWL